LKNINDHLESLVKQRTEDIVIRNQALELSRAILNDLPVPILGLSSDGMVAMTNYVLDDMFKTSIGFRSAISLMIISRRESRGKLTMHL
jgi:hypothetical protein